MLPLLLLSCDAGHGVLSGERLTLAPCLDQAPRSWEPFRMEMNRLSWNHPEADIGILTLQRGFRDPNETDLVVLELRDLGHLVEVVASEPGRARALDEVGRVSLAMNDSCPDFRQPLESRGGIIRLDCLDLSFGGRITGKAWFDLFDRRLPREAPAVGVGMELDFSLDLTEKESRSGEGRR